MKKGSQRAILLGNLDIMCFNASLVQTAEIIEDLFGAEFPEERFDFPAFFMSAFEHPSWPILKQGDTESFVPALWGLVPSWTKSVTDAEGIRDKTLNARLETLSSKPSFRGSVNHQRCGVLVDGFVEWRAYNGKKYPYHIAMPERRPFLLAGIWSSWKDPDSDTTAETFSVVTTEAAGLPAQIHNVKRRMPFILSKNVGEAWLDKDAVFAAIAPHLVPLYRNLVAWPVSKDISKPGANKNNPEIQNPAVYPELPDLEPV